MKIEKGDILRARENAVLTDETFTVTINVRQKWIVNYIDNDKISLKNKNVSIKLAKETIEVNFVKIPVAGDEKC